jgi:hypothetical protein
MRRGAAMVICLLFPAAANSAVKERDINYESGSIVLRGSRNPPPAIDRRILFLPVAACEGCEYREVERASKQSHITEPHRHLTPDKSGVPPPARRRVPPSP